MSIEETNESMPYPSRSFLEKHYDRLSLEADSQIGFAKRGLSVLLRTRNTRIQIKRWIDFFCTFCSCAVGVRGDNPEVPGKSHRCLQRHRPRSSLRLGQPPQSPQSRHRATELHRMMPRMPLLSLRSSNRMRKRRITRSALMHCESAADLSVHALSCCN